MVPIIHEACYFGVIIALRTLTEHTHTLTPKQNIQQHKLTPYQHYMFPLPPICLLHISSFFSSSHTIHVESITHYKTIIPRSTKYVPLHMCSFTSLSSYFMLMILNDIQGDQHKKETWSNRPKSIIRITWKYRRIIFYHNSNNIKYFWFGMFYA